VAAFDRFFDNPAKSDPQCWAKNALAKALKDLGHTGAEVFLRGIAHFQMEPVWGGRQDSAAALRGTCAHALTACEIGAFEALVAIADLLEDPEASVRVEAARAIAHLGAREGVLPLRLKALAGDREPEVVGHCFSALLSLAPHAGLEFVTRFLDRPPVELQVEAAAALAACYEPEAVERLRAFWDRQTDPEIKRTLLTLLGSSPLPEAAGLLLDILRNASAHQAPEVFAALASSRHRARLRPEIAAIVAEKRDHHLQALFDAACGEDG
jgi:HEAT repeat protein